MRQLLLSKYTLACAASANVPSLVSRSYHPTCQCQLCLSIFIYYTVKKDGHTQRPAPDIYRDSKRKATKTVGRTKSVMEALITSLLWLAHSAGSSAGVGSWDADIVQERRFRLPPLQEL